MDISRTRATLFIRSCHLVTTGIACVACEPGLRGTSEAPSRFTLTESSIYTLPPAYVPTGVEASALGSIVTWNATEDGVLLLRPDRPAVTIGSQSVYRPAAAFLSEEDSTIEVVGDAGQGALSIARYNSISGAMLQRTPVDAPTFLDTGVKHPNGWYLGGVHPDQNVYEVYQINAFGRSHLIASLPATPETMDRGAGGHVPIALRTISVAGNQLVITSVAAPYNTILTNGSGRIISAFEPPADLLRTLESENAAIDDQASWISVRTLSLGEAFVQTLSDLRGDRRILLLYGSRGDFISYTQLTVPLALVSTIAESQTVVAVRNVGTYEIVAYRWRWGTDR